MRQDIHYFDRELQSVLGRIKVSSLDPHSKRRLLKFYEQCNAEGIMFSRTQISLYWTETEPFAQATKT